MHWVLKSPVHLSALPTLFAVYPDARLAITHRDPLTVLASLTSLVATLRWAHSDRVDFAEIGRYHERMWTAALDGLITASTDGTLDPARVHHVHYADFMQDQIGVVGELYGALGRPLPPETADAMRATSPGGRRTSTARTSTRSPTSDSTPSSNASGSPLPAPLLGARGGDP